MANLYLSAGDNLSGLTFGGNVFGSTGNEVITYAAGVTGIVADQNVEQVRLQGSSSSYTYQQQGNALIVFSGATQVARITLQNDTNGTLITFSNGTVEAKVSAAGMTLGGGTVQSTAPSTVVITAIDTSNTTSTPQFVLTTGIDALTGTGGDDVFTADKATVTAADQINGAGGNDTLNYFGFDNTVPALPQLDSVETLNFNAPVSDISLSTATLSSVTTVGLVNSTKAFTGGTGLSIGAAQNVAFNNVTSGANTITTTATDTAVGVSLTNSTLGALAVDGAALTTVDFTSNGTANTIASLASTGSETTVNVTGAGNLTITGALATSVKTVNAAAATGKINVGITTATTAAIAADVSTGTGADTIGVATTGAGTTTVATGAGNDTVNITARSTGKLSVNLGAGDDTVTVTGAAIAAGDSIDGGDGKDSLLLQVVGSANIGAFSNFEVFDVKGLDHNLDIDILASKNTVTEITASGALAAAATLSNVGAGVGYRVTGDMGADALTLTQKTAGALTVTLDIDETASATTGLGDRDASVVATNATSVNAVFDSSFFDATKGGNDNTAELDITGTTATSLSVVSGGANASNDLDFTTFVTSGKGALTSVTVTGAQALNLDIAGATTAQSQLATVNASAHTGGLTFDLGDLKAEASANAFNGGNITIGSGDDVLTAATGATITGIEKGTAADATVATGLDVISFTAATQANANGAVTTGTIANGLLTFTGAGPATLADAIVIANNAADATGETVVFQYLNDSYIFNQGGVGADVVIKLAGTTGLTGLDTVGASTNVYVF